ncbi:MAG: hypothetical protein ACP5NK_01200 [Thermoplasmata archaeon]
MPQTESTDFREIVFDTLFQRKGSGITQRELELLYGYSKSYISDVLGELEAKGQIVRREEWGNTKRVWASEYFPHFRSGIIRAGALKSTEYVPFFSFLRNFCLENGYSLKIIPYNDLHSLMDDQCSGLLEISCAPLLAQIMFSMVNGNIAIGGAIASGGSCIIENRIVETDSFATTESSSMILITRGFLSEHHGVSVVPFTDPFKAMEDFLKGIYRYISMWEPFASQIMKRSKNTLKVTSFSDMLDSLPCCSFAFSAEFLSHEEKTISRIRSGYEKYDRGSLSGDEIFSICKDLSLTGIGRDILVDSLKNYNFDCSLGTDILRNYLEKAQLPFTESAVLKVFL